MAEAAALRKENKQLSRAKGGANGAAVMQAQAAEDQRKLRAKETKAVSSKAYKLEKELDTVTDQLETVTDLLKAANLRLYEAEVKAQTSARKMLSFQRISSSAADQTNLQHEQEQKERALLEEKLATVSKMYAELQEVHSAVKEQKELEQYKMLEAQASALADHQSETARVQEEHKQEIASMKEKLGLDTRYNKTPDPAFNGSTPLRWL